jgi:hypothetical protein
VAVVDAVVVLAMQPGHGQDELGAEVDLDGVGVESRLDVVTDQPRRHRVGLLADADGAPLAHLGRDDGVAWHRRRRQRAQVLLLLVERGLHVAILLRDDAGDEGAVVGLAREVGAAAQQERLGERRLGSVMPLLDDAILVRLAGLNSRRA